MGYGCYFSSTEGDIRNAAVGMSIELGHSRPHLSLSHVHVHIFLLLHLIIDLISRLHDYTIIRLQCCLTGGEGTCDIKFNFHFPFNEVYSAYILS